MIQEDVTLVVGADGLIGRALADHLVSAGKQVIETTRRRDRATKKRVFLDISRDISRWSPPRDISVAYICAGVSSLEECRKYPIKSVIVNVNNTVELSKILVKRGIFVIFLSTNLVYNGSVPFRKADEPVCPLTEYGRLKANAERQLLSLGKSISVVRFTKVLGATIPLFEGWAKALKNDEAIHPFSDMVIAPVSIALAVDVLCRVGEVSLPGVLQVSGNKDITYKQVAMHIAEHIGCKSSLVQAIKFVEAYPDAEAAPTYTTLNTSRLRIELKIKPPNIWSLINAIIDQNFEQLR